MALQVQSGTLSGNPIKFSGSFGQNGTLYASPRLPSQAGVNCRPGPSRSSASTMPS